MSDIFKKDQLQFQIVLLQISYIKQICSLIKRSFFYMNPHWKRFHQNTTTEKIMGQYIQKSDQIDTYILPQIEASINSKLGLGIKLKKSQQLICVFTILDIVDYQQILLNKPQSVLDKINQLIQFYKVGFQMQNDFLNKSYCRGLVAYANYIAVKQNYTQYKLATLLYAIGLRHVNNFNYKLMYGKCTNIVSKRLTQKLGTIILHEKQLQKQQK